MKLSDLEKLVAAMRQRANDMNVDDPNVEFYEDDRSSLLEAHYKGRIFLNMDIRPDVPDELHEHVCPGNGSAANRGDFAIPLCMVKE